jgi:hypothetical protein
VVSSTAAHPTHAHTQAHLRSNLPYKFERRARLHHLRQARVRSNALMCIQTYSSWAVPGPIFRSFLPLFPYSAVQPKISPPSLSSLKSKIHHTPHTTATHHFPTTPRPTAGLSPAISPTAGRRFDYFPHFFLFFPKTHFYKNLQFFLIFFVDFGHKSILGLCPIDLGCF